MNVAQQKAIDRTRKLSHLSDIIRTHEGTWIVDECNKLRRENIDIRRRERHLETQLETWLARRGDQRSLDETLGEKASELQSLEQPTVNQYAKAAKKSRRRRVPGQRSLSSRSMELAAAQDLRVAVDESRQLAAYQAHSIESLRHTLVQRSNMAMKASAKGEGGAPDLRSVHSVSTYMPQWSVDSAVSLHHGGISVHTHTYSET